jgi:hypothetical protein
MIKTINMIGRKILAVSLLVLTITALSMSTTTYASNNKNYDRCDDRRHHKPTLVSPTIQYLKYERTQSGVKFYYTVKAGSKDINSVELESTVFRNTKLLRASESKVNYNQKKMTIIFNNNLKAGQSKTIWFELKLSYNGFKLGNIEYDIQAAKSYEGCVKGPQLGSSYTPPHN